MQLYRWDDVAESMSGYLKKCWVSGDAILAEAPVASRPPSNAICATRPYARVVSPVGTPCGPPPNRQASMRSPIPVTIANRRISSSQRRSAFVRSAPYSDTRTAASVANVELSNTVRAAVTKASAADNRRSPRPAVAGGHRSPRLQTIPGRTQSPCPLTEFHALTGNGQARSGRLLYIVVASHSRHRGSDSLRFTGLSGHT